MSVTADWRYTICPHCGYVNFYLEQPKFPICECCDYEDPIVMTYDDCLAVGRSVNSHNALETEEALCEKYVYPSEHFSKKAYNHMLKYREEVENKAKEDMANFGNPHTPKCPTCGSTNLRKVSVGAKTVSVGLFGIFSQKVKKTWHCNSCGYEW